MIPVWVGWERRSRLSTMNTLASLRNLLAGMGFGALINSKYQTVSCSFFFLLSGSWGRREVNSRPQPHSHSSEASTCPPDQEPSNSLHLISPQPPQSPDQSSRFSEIPISLSHWLYIYSLNPFLLGSCWMVPGEMQYQAPSTEHYCLKGGFSYAAELSGNTRGNKRGTGIHHRLAFE